MGNIIDKKQKQLSRAVLNYRAYAYQLPYDFSEFLILNTGNEIYDTAEFKAEMPFSQEYIIYMLMREVIERRSSRPEEIVEEWLTGDEAVYGGCFCRNFTGGPLDIDTKCLNGKIPSGDHELLVLLIRINSAFNREEATLSTEEDIDRVTREFQKKLTEVKYSCRVYVPEDVEIISWCEKAVSTVSSYRKWLLREYVRVTLYKRIKGFMQYLVYRHGGRFGELLRDRVKMLKKIDNLEIDENRLEDLRYDTVFKVCAESNYKKLNYVVIDTEIASAANKLLVTLGEKEFRVSREMERKYQEVFRIRERLVRIQKTTYYALLIEQDREEAYYEASAVVSRCASWITADMPETRKLLCQTNLLMTVRNEFFEYKDNGARDESTHLER